MKDRDEQLLTEIARRNWLILALLLLLTLPWRSVELSTGVLCGGIVAIFGYRWLHRSLQRTLENPTRQSAKGFQFGYLIRLGTLAVALYVLIAVAGVHPIGLAIGLSVVVINILWTTLKRSF